jgi:hypothetical protein
MNYFGNHSELRGQNQTIFLGYTGKSMMIIEALHGYPWRCSDNKRLCFRLLTRDMSLTEGLNACRYLQYRCGDEDEVGSRIRYTS